MEENRVFIKFSLIFIVLLVSILIFQPKEIGPNAEAMADDMQRAFSERKWELMDSIYRDSLKSAPDGGLLSSMDVSLYVNGLWMQGRYGEVTDILSSSNDNFPKELKPYANMLLMLGFERTGRKEEAYRVGKTLEAEAPDPLKYYIFYALGRLSRELSLDEDALSWFRMMYKCAPDRSRRVQALRQIVAMSGALPREAAQLLLDSPRDAKARSLCAALPAGREGIVDYAMGYHEYISRRYANAMPRFVLASADRTYGEASRYLYAYSAYRLKSDDIALEAWSELALTGSEYSKRAIQRLSALGARGNTGVVLEVLSNVADVRAASDDISAEALSGIIKLGSKNEVKAALNDLVTKHPGSEQAVTARWNEGWRAWKAGRYSEAESEWSKALSQKTAKGEMCARLMYWQHRSLLAQGRSEDARLVKESLVKDYPSEYHSFLVDQGGGISDAPIPESYIKPSLAELWGFLTYARLDVSSVSSVKRDIATLFSAVRLALADGDFSSAVRSFEVLRRAITAGERASAELLRCTFPRAFEREVIDASQKTGVEPAVIWGIMRQESLFEADVTSSAGAYGLMQLMPGTAKGEAAKLKLPADTYKKAQGNILLGAAHIAGLISKFGDLPRALAAYNAGSAPVNRWSREPITDMAEWVEEIGYNETRGYVKAVMRNIQAYRLLYPEK